MSPQEGVAPEALTAEQKEVERLMVEGAAEALRVVRENVTCYQKSPNDNVEDWLYDGQEIDELDPAEIVRAHLASKPAPEAGEYVGVDHGKAGGDYCDKTTMHREPDGSIIIDNEETLKREDCHTCTPAPPAVCEACADPVYRLNPYKPHTCNSSGA